MKLRIFLTSPSTGSLQATMLVDFDTTPESLARAFSAWDEATDGLDTRDPYNPGKDFWFDFASDNAKVEFTREQVTEIEVEPIVTFAINRDLVPTIVVVRAIKGANTIPQWYFVKKEEVGGKFTLIKPKLRIEADGSLIGDGVYFPHDDEFWPSPVLDGDDFETHGILNWLLCKRESSPLRALIKSGQPYKGHALQVLTAIERLKKVLDE